MYKPSIADAVSYSIGPRIQALMKSIGIDEATATQIALAEGQKLIHDIEVQADVYYALGSLKKEIIVNFRP